jgi:hypothetical protein
LYKIKSIRFLFLPWRRSGLAARNEKLSWLWKELSSTQWSSSHNRKQTMSRSWLINTCFIVLTKRQSESQGTRFLQNWIFVFVSLHKFCRALHRVTQRPIQCVPWALSPRINRRGVKLTTHFHLVPRSRTEKLYLQFSLSLHGLVLN